MLQNVDLGHSAEYPVKRRRETPNTPSHGLTRISDEQPVLPLEVPQKAGVGAGKAHRKNAERVDADNPKPQSRKVVKKRVTKCRNCRKSTRGTARKVFCSDQCRAAYRTKQQRAERLKNPPMRVEKHYSAATCQHCRCGFIPTNAAAMYCSKACRNKAADTRREAAIQIWAQHFGRSREWAADCIDIAGMRRTSAALAALGYAYEVNARAWLPSAALVTA